MRGWQYEALVEMGRELRYEIQQVRVDILLETTNRLINELERTTVPNRTVYTDDKTTTLVLKALAGDGELDFGQVLSALERMQAAGIQFGLEIEARKLGPRKKNADGTESDEPDAPEGTKQDTPQIDPPVQQ